VLFQSSTLDWCDQPRLTTVAWAEDSGREPCSWPLLKRANRIDQPTRPLWSSAQVGSDERIEENVADGVVRSALLVASDSPWLRDHATTMPFIKRAVRRFMPGERLEDAIAATVDLQPLGIGTVLTRLGENIRDAAAAEETARHYITVCKEISARSLDSHISVKLTQLELDIDAEGCRARLLTLAEETRRRGVRLWIDMEQSAYVDRTLEMRRALREFPHVGVCLQAYLYRISPRSSRSAAAFASSRAPTASRRPSRSRARPTWTRTTSRLPRRCSNTTRRFSACSARTTSA